MLELAHRGTCGITYLQASSRCPRPSSDTLMGKRPPWAPSVHCQGAHRGQHQTLQVALSDDPGAHRAMLPSANARAAQCASPGRRRVEVESGLRCAPRLSHSGWAQRGSMRRGGPGPPMGGWHPGTGLLRAWAQCQPLPGLALGLGLLRRLLRRLRHAAPISRVLPSPSTDQGVEQKPSAAYGVMSVSTT